MLHCAAAARQAGQQQRGGEHRRCSACKARGHIRSALARLLQPLTTACKSGSATAARWGHTASRPARPIRRQHRLSMHVHLKIVLQRSVGAAAQPPGSPPPPATRPAQRRMCVRRGCLSSGAMQCGNAVQGCAPLPTARTQFCCSGLAFCQMGHPPANCGRQRSRKPVTKTAASCCHSWAPIPS